MFSHAAACCRMDRASGFSCFVMFIVSDELPNMITVVMLSSIFFIGIHVVIPMQAFITCTRVNLGFTRVNVGVPQRFTYHICRNFFYSRISIWSETLRKLLF